MGDQKHESPKEKTDTLDFFKTKSAYVSKDSIKKAKRQPMGETT